MTDIAYTIRRISGRNDLDETPTEALKYSPWTDVRIAPRTFFCCGYMENEALLIRMTCLESEPLARYTEPDAPVCRDSCMECFLCFDDTQRYLNLEANAFGALHCGFGSSRQNRVFLRSMSIRKPTCTVERTDASWRVDFTIPAETVRALYGLDALISGETLRANFYKCGDETAQPHYLSRFPIDLPAPDFHAPAFFGALLLE